MRERLITLHDDKLYHKLETEQHSTLAKVISSAVPADELRHLSPDHRVKIKIAVYSYIMHLVSYNTMKRVIANAGLSKNNAKNIKESIVSQYDANIALRQVTLITYERLRQAKRANVRKTLKLSEMNEGDAFILNNISSFQFTANNRQNLLSKVKEHPLLMPTQIRKNCDGMIANSTSFIRSKVYKKLRFIYESNGYHPDDFVADVKRKGVEAFYRLTPYYTPLHRENSVRRSMENQISKEITKYTAKKRSRMNNDDGVFSSVVESFNYGVDNSTNDLHLIDETWNDAYENVEIQHIINDFVHSGSPNRARIVHCLMGQNEDAEFVKFCALKLKTGELFSLEQLHLDKTKMYMQYIAEYHDVPLLTVKLIAWKLLRLIQGHNIKDCEDEA